MKRRTAFIFILMIFLLFVLFVWNLSSGSTKVPPSDVFKIIFGKIFESRAGGEPGREGLLQAGGTFFESTVNFSSVQKIIFSIRLPRILSAIILGGALALSGFLLQTFFANPIAGPYVLGISSGARLFVALFLILFLQAGKEISSFGMVGAAFLGSLFTMGIVLLFSLKVQNMSVLIVCGIFTGYICSAVTDFFVTFAQDSSIVNLHYWSLGSFSGISGKDVKVMILIVAFCVAAAVLLSKPIGAFQLGENYAKSSGVNVKLLRLLLILISSLLSACVTAFAGPVSFVGIAVPHLVKGIFKSSRPLVLIPACFLGGAIVTVFCDGICRTVFAPREVSISSVTSVLLVPVVIFMMIKNQRR